MILHFYMARRFAAYLGIVALIMFVLVLLVDQIDHTRRFFDRDVSFGQLLRLSLLKGPQTLNRVLPLTMIVATLWLFIALARSSELVVMRAVGRSAFRALIAPMTVALMVGVFATTMLGPIVAATSERYAALEQSYKSGGVSTLAISEDGLWLREGDETEQIVIRASQSNTDASILYDVTFIAYAPGAGPQRRIEADSASLTDGKWLLRQAKVWSLTEGQNAEAEAVTHETFTLPSTLTPDQIRENLGAPGSISIWDMPEFIEQLQQAGLSVRRHHVWLQTELARPAFLAGMVLVAAAFTMRHTRFGGTGAAVLSALLLGFGLYFIRSFAQILGENAQIPVLLSAWAPPVAAILFGLGLLLRAEDG